MSLDLETAARRAAAAHAAGHGTAADFTTLGWHDAMAGNTAEAAAFFERALALDPHEADAMIGLAGLQRAAGRLREAALRCDAAIASAPHHIEAWLERAYVMAAGGVMDEARHCYEVIIAIMPGHAAANAGLAGLAARDGNAEHGRQHAYAALATDPANSAAIAALATIELEAGNSAAAHTLIQPALAQMFVPSAERMELLHIFGDTCGALRKADAAYVAYAQAKADFAALYAPSFAGRQPHREFLEGITAGVAAMDVAGWQPGAQVEGAVRHLFVLGYPRSGNTLLENVLASLPGTAAIEERPTLREADTAFLLDPSGLARFATLDDIALEPFRAAYWQRVAATGVDLAGGTLVDMDPLKSIRLPLIARLFPQARILLVRRDPRDVVWSCFRTSFALSNAAMDFTTLESAARHYDALMRLTEAAIAKLPMAVHEVHYHRMVQDFDGATRAICAFAGLAWSEELRRFDRTARQRGVSTASARQVRRGLYDGTRQWEPYAAYLEPVMPILKPWIERLGYAI